MGKSLIIPGADFSANAIEQREIWYSDEGISYPDSLPNNFIYNRLFTTQLILDSVQGKTVNAIRIPKNNTSGEIRLSVSSSIENGDPFSIIDYTDLQIPHVSQITTFKLNKKLIISQSQGLWITVLSPVSSDMNIPNCLLFNMNAPAEAISIFYEDSESHISKTSGLYYFGIDFGYIE